MTIIVFELFTKNTMFDLKFRISRAHGSIRILLKIFFNPLNFTQTIYL